jgi:hypothetical protein
MATTAMHGSEAPRILEVLVKQDRTHEYSGTTNEDTVDV